jgi:hypothetical protein
VLLSSRIRNHLADTDDSAAVEVKLPSIDDAVKLLMDAAGMPFQSEPPPEAVEIVGLCGRLPLAVTVAGKALRDMTCGQNWTGVVQVRSPPCTAIWHHIANCDVLSMLCAGLER